MPRSAYADKLLSHSGLVFTDGAERQQSGRWRAHFCQRIGSTYDQKLVLEIGCADAALLAPVAAVHPTTAFVGLDWKYRALHQAAERTTTPNLALLRARAQDVPHLFSTSELDEIWLFHPDPPDRLFHEPFLLAAHHTLRTGGTLTLKTDHPGYFQHALALLNVAEPPSLRTRPKIKSKEFVSPSELPVPNAAVTERFDVSCVSADFWDDPAAQSVAAARAFAGRATLFESRFVKKRLPIYYLELIAK